MIIAVLLGAVAGLGINIGSDDLSDEKYITVEIKGEVQHPGTYELKLGSTIEDLFDMAMLKEEADTSQYSLNGILYNSQVIVVSRIRNNLISINTASLEELEQLPGIGPGIAQRIIDYRSTYGSFNYLEELKNVNGIGDGKYRKIKEFICL